MLKRQHIYRYIDIYISIYILMYIYCMLPFQTENGSPGNFLNPFPICSSCKWKFVVCPFVYEEQTGVVCLQTD